MNKMFMKIIVLLLVIICVLAIGIYTYSLFEGIAPASIQSIPATGIIPSGFYNIPNSTNMAPIPFGFKIAIVDSSGNGTLTKMTQSEIYSAKVGGFSPVSDSSANPHFDSNKYDTQYHETADQLTKTDSSNSGTWILDNSGNKIFMNWSDVSGSVTYYTPGTYTYGPSSYVPNYEDSILLSRTTGQGTTTPLYDTAAMKGGFCLQNAASKGNMEQICNVINKNECASTECCVLLAGTKCVAGDEKGPYFKSNYSDPFIRNKDVYYYKGKCFGNCENDFFPRML